MGSRVGVSVEIRLGGEVAPGHLEDLTLAVGDARQVNRSEDLAAGRLVSVLDAYTPLVVPLYAAFPDRRFLPASVLALLDPLADAFGCA